MLHDLVGPDDEGGVSLQLVRSSSRSSKELYAAAARCITVRSAYVVLASGIDRDALKSDAGLVLRSGELPFPSSGGSSWSLRLLLFEPSGQCVKGGRSTELEVIALFWPMLAARLLGRVSLTSPDVALFLLEGLALNAGDGEVHTSVLCYRATLGLTERQGTIAKTRIASRPYHGTTTMGPESALLTASFSRCGVRAKRVLDPFVGTGGLIVAAAELGATNCVGIDVNEEAGCGAALVARNLAHYGLSEVVTYASVHGDARDPAAVGATVRSLDTGGGRGSTTPLFDAILTDPPYGVRESAKHGGGTAAAVLCALAVLSLIHI